MKQKKMDSLRDETGVVEPRIDLVVRETRGRKLITMCFCIKKFHRTVLLLPVKAAVHSVRVSRCLF